MTALLAIARREYLALFRTSTGWIVAAIFTLLTGLVLSLTTLNQGEVATLRPVVSAAHWTLLFVAPAISMRLLAEEARTQTLEPLMSTPASDFAIAAGKFTAGLLALATLLAATAPAILTLRLLAPIEPGPIVTGYLGVVLAAGLYLAVGLACSALTQSQVTAFLATLAIMTAWNALPALAPQANIPILATAAEHLSIADRLATFARGVIDTADVVFFLSTWWVGVALTAAALSWRRWA